MSWWHPHPDAARIVRDHWRHADLVIVAHQPPCIKIRDDELANLDRLVMAANPEQLLAWAPGRRHSWMVAVLVCKGDDLQPLADAVRELRLEPDRFHFYLHEDASLETLRPWIHGGFSFDHIDTDVKDWKGLHKLLGIDFNVRIVEDFLSSGSSR